jgi:sphingomyelin phosphodiesterase
VDSLYKTVNSDQQQRKTYKVLHITDPHIDFEYQPGTNANCGAPICCREASGQPPVESDAAGPWGDYRCDVPIKTVNVMFDYIQQQFNPDLIFWTGDNVPHDVWAQSVQENTDATLNITSILKDKFPQAQVFPVVGNHEPFPVNAIDFNDKDSYMLNAFADAWSEWIPAEDLITFRRYGYYQVKIPQSVTGSPTRLIGLHTNA